MGFHAITLFLPGVLKTLWGNCALVFGIVVVLPTIIYKAVLYLFLLAWARTEPLHAWGHTITLPLLWNHASARIFRIFLAVPDGSSAARGLAQKTNHRVFARDRQHMCPCS